MTKLWVFSDLHRDYEDWRLPAVPEADVCVVAGDVSERLFNALDWLRDTVAPHMPVVYVAGNHDYYREAVVEARREAQDRCGEYAAAGVHFLDDRVLVHGDVRFLGTTLWTDFELGNPNPAPAMHAANRAMNDYKRVKWSKQPFRKFTPELSRGMHFKGRRFLEETMLDVLFRGRTVVVSHHAPHRNSLAEFDDTGKGFFDQAAFRALDPAYGSDLSDLMLQHRPQLWVHGHVHQGRDYHVGTTRVVCNPRGYGGENLGFQPQLVVEV